MIIVLLNKPLNLPFLCRDVDYPTQTTMMSFKHFLSQQDDNISDADAIKKYNDYKLDFRKQQINEFFLAHKDEEWWAIWQLIRNLE